MSEVEDYGEPFKFRKGNRKAYEWAAIVSNKSKETVMIGNDIAVYKRAVECLNALAGLNPDAVRGLVDEVRHIVSLLGKCDHTDHHGNCQTHFNEQPCSVRALKSALAALEGREG